jgi:hypothetical protein
MPKNSFSPCFEAVIVSSFLHQILPFKAWSWQILPALSDGSHEISINSNGQETIFQQPLFGRIQPELPKIEIYCIPPLHLPDSLSPPTSCPELAHSQNSAILGVKYIYSPTVDDWGATPMHCL